MIVIGSNTSNSGQSCFTEDVSHFLAHLIHHQMCLCYQKLEIYHFCGKRPNSASFHYYGVSEIRPLTTKFGLLPQSSACFAPQPLATCHVIDFVARGRI